MDMLMLVQAFIGSALSLIILSLVFKENPLYTFGEHLLVGAISGYLLTMAGRAVYSSGFAPLIRGNMIYVVAVILSALLYFRLSPKYAWIARYPLAFLVGVGTGILIRTTPEAEVVAQIREAARPLYGGDLVSVLNNIVMVVFSISTLFYFVFTVKQRGPSKWLSRVGQYGMMLSFGALMGNTILGRVSTLTQLVKSYIIAEPNVYFVPFIAAGLLVAMYKDRLVKRRARA